MLRRHQSRTAVCREIGTCPKFKFGDEKGAFSARVPCGGGFENGFWGCGFAAAADVFFSPVEVA